MAKTKVTPEVEKFILENYLKMSRGAIARHFGFSNTVCNEFYKNKNLVVPKEIIEEFRKTALTGRTNFSAAEDKFIEDNYLSMPIKTIGTCLGRSGCGISGRMKNLKLVIPEEIIEQRKKDSHFDKGHVPENKGLKQIDYMSTEAIEKTKATRFQKGQIPKNALPDNTEVFRPDKRSGRVYVLIKVPGIKKLKHKQIHVWETHHKKKLPPGHNIVFADGNTLNFEPENLECISDSELMSRNTIHQYPEELQQIIKLKNKLTKAINENRSRIES